MHAAAAKASGSRGRRAAVEGGELAQATDEAEDVEVRRAELGAGRQATAMEVVREQEWSTVEVQICRGGEPRPGCMSPSGPSVGGGGGRLSTRLIARHKAGSCIAFHLLYRFRQRVLRRRQKEATDAAVRPTPTPKLNPALPSPQDCGETSVSTIRYCLRPHAARRSQSSCRAAPSCGYSRRVNPFQYCCPLLAGQQRATMPQGARSPRHSGL